MTAHRGYFSLIQYCPDASRLEAANVGVVLFCPELSFLAARTSHGNDRVRRFFGRESFDPVSLSSAKLAMERRIVVEGERIRSLEQFQHFIATRANELKLTAPRPMQVADPAADLQSLFDELVGGRAKREPRTKRPSAIRQLHETFKQLADEGRAKLDYPVSVPIAGLDLKVPYAFRNGVWNLVKPQRFVGSELQVVGAAMRLAMEGDLLQRHGEDREGKKKLIVVSSFDASLPAAASNRVDKILSEYSVRDVPEKDIPKFVKEVVRVAH